MTFVIVPITVIQGVEDSLVVWVRNCSTDIFLVKLLHSVRFVTLCEILTSQQEVETVCQLISRNANQFNHRFLCFCFVLDCMLAFLLLLFGVCVCVCVSMCVRACVSE